MKYNSKSKVGREGGHRIGLKLQKGLVKGGWWSSKMEFYQDCKVKLHVLEEGKTNKQTGTPTNCRLSRKMPLLALNSL